MGDIAFQICRVKTLHACAVTLAHVPPSTVLRQNPRKPKEGAVNQRPTKVETALGLGPLGSYFSQRHLGPTHSTRAVVITSSFSMSENVKRIYN